jgi:hypothetical protein
MNKLRSLLVAGTVLAVLSSIILIGNGLAAAAAFGTPTPTPTRTPTRPPDLISRLTRTLFFSPGGGLSRNSAFNCRTDGYPEDSPPTIWFYGRAEYDIQEGALCMINLPVDIPFTIVLTAPDGTQYNQEMSTGDGYQGFDYEDDGGGLTYGMIRLWLSPDVQPGEWQVEYFAENDYHTYSVQFEWPKNTPNLYIPRSDPNPFELPQDFFTLGAAHLYQITKLDPGGTLKLTGYNLPAGKEAPVGLFQVSKVKDKDEELRLVQAIAARANSNGELSFSFKLDKGLPPGGYYLGVITNLKANNVYNSGAGLGVYVNACPGVMDSRLMVGDKIRLDTDNMSDIQENNLYNQPGLGNKKTGQLGPALTADIKDGPVCANDRVWWKVRTSKGKEGWIAEAFDFTRFLIRVNK